ncbi:aaa family protein [Moniliophthora roreri MCA 2997]|uniref:Aaa family protein n=2 Tax=Moniliophthora roreri TaxID=221103 RepID=V2YWD2_MONRO|nr:aaa family protein [Moniliophthora roreri MCA 2997]
MAEKKKTGISRNSKGKQSSSTQKSLLDLFPKKQKKGSELKDASADNLKISGPSKREDSPLSAQGVPAVDTSSSLGPPGSSSPLPGNCSSPPVQAEEPEPTVEGPVEIYSSESPEILKVNLPSIEAGSHEDNPIVLDSSPLKAPIEHRKKDGIGASTAKKEVYSIFAPRERKAAAPAPSSSPLKSTPSSSTADKEAPFPSKDSQHVRGPQSDFPNIIRIPSHPSRRPIPKTTYIHDDIPLQHIIPSDAGHDELSPNQPTFQAHPDTSPSDRAGHLTQNIPTSHQAEQPIISHLVSLSIAAEPLDEAQPQNRLWTEKWRPTKAEHILHNQEHAIYLRDWLSALELQLEVSSTTENGEETPSGDAKQKKKDKGKQAGSKGIKRPRVLRAVQKQTRKRRRIDSDDEDMDDWIVPDDFADEEELMMLEDEPVEADDNADYRPPRLHRRGSLTPQDTVPSPSGPRKSAPKYVFEDQLTNTIVLAGPPGSGKTAAVYACAEELGWEVFEVYPGIGRRNAANLDNLVGDVGKNHLVRKARGKDLAKAHDSSIKSLFLRNKQREPGQEDGEVETVFNHRYRSPSTDFGFVEQPASDAQCKPCEGAASTHFRQSLILLEEVDILYKDDTNFWPAVVNLIKDCKRPVICTCNDLSLIPVSDLPLQDIRVFEPCPAPVAQSFLQALCCAEGYIAEPDSLSMLCTLNSRYETNRHEYCLDLRRAINHLQLWCPVNESGRLPCEQSITWKPRPEELQDQIEQIDWNVPIANATYPKLQGQTTRTYHADLVSFADCHLIRNPFDISTAKFTSSLDDMQPTGNDVLGHRVLFYPNKSNAIDHFGYSYDRDEMIMSSAIGLSRGKLTGIRLSGARELVEPRVEYETLVKEIGKNRAVSVNEKLRRRVFDMDYLPWIREMIRVDDEMEKESMKEDKIRVGRRRTRNSQKDEHVRTILVSWEERKGMARSEFSGESQVISQVI